MFERQVLPRLKINLIAEKGAERFEEFPRGPCPPQKETDLATKIG
jgi:hypothetical protein